MAEQRFHCPFCRHAEQLSTEDPDASFGQVLSHIRWRHPDEDQSPEVLWPKIAVTTP